MAQVELNKTDWILLGSFGAATVVPYLLEAPLQDYLFYMGPIGLSVAFFLHLAFLEDSQLSHQLNASLQLITNSPSIFVSTWAAVTLVVGWGMEKILDFLEPVLDIFEFFLPEGMYVEWFLSPYSPQFALMMGLGTFMLTIAELGVLSYGIYTFMYTVGKYFPIVTSWKTPAQVPILDPPHSKGHTDFFNTKALLGGRQGNSGEKSTYGIGFLPQDFFQLCMAMPIVYGNVLNTVISGTQYGKKLTLGEKLNLLLFASPNSAIYMYHRFADCVLDLVFFDSQWKLCIDTLWPSIVPNFFGGAKNQQLLNQQALALHCGMPGV
jgi:hypothetical protein